MAIIPTFVVPNCQTHHFLAESESLGLTVAETSESLPLDGVPVQWRSSDTQTPEATALQKMTQLQTVLSSHGTNMVQTCTRIGTGAALQASKPNVKILEHSVEGFSPFSLKHCAEGR